MRLGWFSDNTVRLRADNFARLSRFRLGPTALLVRSASVSIMVFRIIITDYKIDVQQTDIQQNGEGVDNSGRRVRAKLR